MTEQHEPTEQRLLHRRPIRLPTPLIYLIVIGVVASWVPFAWIALSRVSLKRNPPLHLFQDMLVQPKLTAQSASPLFTDGRAMRPEIPGTVSRNGLQDDDFFFRGYVTNDADGRPVEVTLANGQKDRKWFAGYPSQVSVTPDLMARGQQRFDIYCAPCHGQSGDGNGMVNVRAQKLATNGWVQPANLTQVGPDGKSTFGEAAYPNGKLFNTITHGINTMPAYGAQITPADRWAIIAYVRALQLSQNGRVNDLTSDQQGKLR